MPSLHAAFITYIVTAQVQFCTVGADDAFYLNTYGDYKVLGKSAQRLLLCLTTNSSVYMACLALLIAVALRLFLVPHPEERGMIIEDEIVTAKIT